MDKQSGGLLSGYIPEQGTGGTTRPQPQDTLALAQAAHRPAVRHGRRGALLQRRGRQTMVSGRRDLHANASGFVKAQARVVTLQAAI